MKRWQQATQEELKKYVPDPDREIERLQEQVNEANHILKHVFISDGYYKSKRAQYIRKWGVK